MDDPKLLELHLSDFKGLAKECEKYNADNIILGATRDDVPGFKLVFGVERVDEDE